MTMRPLYRSIAVALTALNNCRHRDEESEWEDKWERYLLRCSEVLPRGGGFDIPPVIRDEAPYTRIVIDGNFHPMDAAGGYKAWVEYRVIVYADLANGYYLKVTCKDADLREFIYDEFAEALSREFEADFFFEK